MQSISEVPPTPSLGSTRACDELAAMCATVERLRENLLDYNPLLAVMADALQKAVQLEIESRRCNMLHGDPV